MADGDEDLFSTLTPVDQNVDKRTTVRGFHKALLLPGIERDSWASLKEGLTIFYNTAASAPTRNPSRLLGLVQLWGFVSHVYVRGGEVIRGVYPTPASSSSGVEEVK